MTDCKCNEQKIHNRVVKLEQDYRDLEKHITMLEIETRGNTYRTNQHTDLIERGINQLRDDLKPIIEECKNADSKCGFCESVRRWVISLVGKLK